MEALPKKALSFDIFMYCTSKVKAILILWPDCVTFYEKICKVKNIFGMPKFGFIHGFLIKKSVFHLPYFFLRKNEFIWVLSHFENEIKFRNTI